MCGISGVISKSKDSAELKEAVLRMNKEQARRGPDDEGVFTDAEKGIALGHRRLSIIDLSPAGKGPMARGDLQITFNGEIYNFRELRAELVSSGEKFKTKTDTEVILALYEKFGTEAFGKLRGMFAFGLWDGYKNKLFLVRDRYGIKPLYYSDGGSGLVFASTVKAIQRSGIVDDRSDQEAVMAFLLFGSMPGALTTMKDVFALPAGHYMEWESGNTRIEKYYDQLSFFKEESLSGKETIGLTRDILEEATRLHLISDAPLGVFLSGGLDSSTLAVLASKERESPITTLSINFKESEFSEKKYQDILAERIRSNHIEIKLSKQDFFDSLDEFFEAMDQPSVDGVNSFLIAKTAKEAGLKTVLSGAGSDEIFCGYSEFKRAGLLRNIQSMPFAFRNSVSVAMSALKNERAIYLKRPDPLAFYMSTRGLFSPGEVAKILESSEEEVIRTLYRIGMEHTVASEKELASLHPVNLTSFMDMNFYLKDQLLRDTDTMSMHHSVEVRVPFLDHKLVEHVSRTPPGVKLPVAGGPNKPALAGAVKDLLPAEIIDREKMGFAFPFADWISSAPGHVIPKEISGSIKNSRTHWSKPWAQFVLSRFNK